MLSGERIFAVDGEEYGWRDVIVAAARSGVWARGVSRSALDRKLAEATDGKASAAVMEGKLPSEQQS